MEINRPCYYLPIPPRAWSRVETSCPNNMTDMEQKGNVLQYRAQSAFYTKKQRYSRIAKNEWTSRTKSWASQTDKRSEPNTTMMQRNGSINIRISAESGEILGPTLLPVTCPTNQLDVFFFDTLPTNQTPSNASSSSSSSILPPTVMNANDLATVLPTTYSTIPVPNDMIIQDGGVLVCGTYENPCTGELYQKPVNPITCNLTTDSDVPGRISSLCWNNRHPTWLPKQSRQMNNSVDKWPINATLFSAIHHTPSPSSFI